MKSNKPCTSEAFNRVMVRCQALIRNVQRSYIIAATDDERLTVLAKWLYEIGDDARLIPWAKDEQNLKQHQVNLQFCLGNLVAFCLLWLSAADANYRRAIGAIATERARQQELFAAGKLPFTGASPVADPRRKFRVLFEEAGEVANAIDQVENHGMAVGNITMEVTHTAAVAVAWLESFESSSSSSSSKGAKR